MPRLQETYICNPQFSCKQNNNSLTFNFLKYARLNFNDTDKKEILYSEMPNSKLVLSMS